MVAGTSPRHRECQRRSTQLRGPHTKVYSDSSIPEDHYVPSHADATRHPLLRSSPSCVPRMPPWLFPKLAVHMQSHEVSHVSVAISNLISRAACRRHVALGLAEVSMARSAFTGTLALFSSAGSLGRSLRYGRRKALHEDTDMLLNRKRRKGHV